MYARHVAGRNIVHVVWAREFRDEELGRFVTSVVCGSVEEWCLQIKGFASIDRIGVVDDDDAQRIDVVAPDGGKYVCGIHCDLRYCNTRSRKRANAMGLYVSHIWNM